MKTAIVSGCLGQDGSFLTEYLRSLDYHVVGITRRHSSDASSYGHLKHLRDDKYFELHHGDINDPIFLTDLICKYQPAEWYALAAQSHVGQSFKEPIETFTTDATATILQLALLQKHSSDTRFYFAATSEIFGGLNCPKTGYTEQSPFYPRSPYGVAKLASYCATINYREAYGMKACSGILFNHGSPRRGFDFIERKITNTVAKIKLGLVDKIVLGNLDAYRDLGHSKDYVRAQHMMLQRDKFEEFVISTGETHQIREIVDVVFKLAGIYDYEQYIHFDSNLMRPSEVPYLLGDSTRARTLLGWKPSYDFHTLLDEMYKSDYDSIRSVIS